MGKIYYLMGKSSSGKDTIFKKLIENKKLQLKTLVGYTTRPIRDGEKDGVEYYFVDEKKMKKMEGRGIVIERRSYNTVYGVWNYFTAHDGQVDLSRSSYILIGTLDSYMKVRDYYGKNQVVPIYIEVDDGVRLMRALQREMKEDNPKYTEMCRRFIADQEDFSNEKLRECGIIKTYLNTNIEDCVSDIAAEIEKDTNWNIIVEN